MTAAALALPTLPRAGRWSPGEDEILRANYRTLGAAGTAEILGRDFGSVCKRADRLNLSYRRRWTRQQDAQLRGLWGDTPIAKISAATGRSVSACATRASDLGLGRGPRDGVELVTTAVRRVGYNRQTLLKILKWHGTKPSTITSLRDPRTKAKRSRKAFDSDDIDDAVTEYLKTETLEEAARSRGLDREKLIRILEASGADVSERPGRYCQWRVSTKDIDRALAVFESRETLGRAAKRHHISRYALQRLLIGAGVEQRFRESRRWFLEPAVVDRVVADAVKARPRLRDAVAAARRQRPTYAAAQAETSQ